MPHKARGTPNLAATTTISFLCGPTSSHLAFLWAAVHINAVDGYEAATTAITSMTSVQQTVPFYAQRRLQYLQTSTARKRRRVVMPDHADEATALFAPLDCGAVSDAIPAFYIGRDANGFWVAREAKGRIGGLFLLKRSALSFARASSPNGCATVFPAEHFELDIENNGNPFASCLAPLVRLARRLQSGFPA